MSHNRFTVAVNDNSRLQEGVDSIKDFLSESNRVNVKNGVIPIAQPSQMSCWAAAATMIYNWKSGMNRSIADVVALAGPRFTAIYKASFANPPQGISPPDEAAFYQTINLRVIQRQNPTIQSWGDLLQQHGLSIGVRSGPLIGIQKGPPRLAF
jgi:hypothetical protein